MKFKHFRAFNEGFDHVDEIKQALTNSMEEYHEASQRLHNLQKKFIDTPKENIKERESLKRALIEASREMISKQSTFHSNLAENGDGDIFNDNTDQ